MNFVIFLFASLLVDTSQGATFCTSGNELCFESFPQTSSMIFEIQSTVKGWVGIGIGSSMSDADVIMAFVVDGQAYAQARIATMEALPAPNNNEQLKLLYSTAASNGRYLFNVSRPLTVSGPGKSLSAKDGAIDMIWAYSTQPMSSPTDLQQHNNQGQTSINLFSAQSVTGSSSGSSATKYSHGILMFISWGICIPSAIFIARFMKRSGGGGWFKAHVILGVLALVLSSIALLVILVSEWQNVGSVHGILGLSTFVLAVIQGCLGQYINAKFNPVRSRIPLHDKAHWWIGRTVYILAVVTMAMGILNFVSYEKEIMIAYLIFTGIVVLVFIFGQVRYGQTHHDHDIHHNHSQLEEERQQVGKGEDAIPLKISEPFEYHQDGSRRHKRYSGFK